MGIRIQQTNVMTILGVCSALILSACSSTGAPATPGPKTGVAVQLSWVHTFEFAGLYMAEKEGYYAEQNLGVEIQNGGYGSDGAYIDPVQRVVDGQAAFGITGADVVLTRRAEGQPIVAVASIYQRSPVALISLGKANVRKPQDLIGKKIATEPGTSVGIAYDALLSSQNISHAQVIEIPRTDFTTAPILSGEVDVLVSFITDDGINAKAHDPGANIMLVSDYGIDIYSNVIFTTEDMIKNHPEVVEGFVRATARGLQKALDEPDGAAQYVVDHYGKDLTDDYRALQKQGMLVSVPLIKPAGTEPGQMQAEKWDATYQILVKQGLLARPVDVRAAYTLQFIDKAYAAPAKNN